MRAVIQRVKKASVVVNNRIVSQINAGYLVFLGICRQDTTKDAQLLAHKISHLRLMADSQDKMNLSLTETSGQILVVSQFTLYSQLSGFRPSFITAAPAPQAKKLYQDFITKLREQVPVQTGIFGAKMQISLINDGPVTIILDTENSK